MLYVRMVARAAWLREVTARPEGTARPIWRRRSASERTLATFVPRITAPAPPGTPGSTVDAVSALSAELFPASCALPGA
jgi:hypothetical protein